VATKAWWSKVCFFFYTFDGKNQQEELEDTESTSGSGSSNDSRKQSGASHSFKTSWLKLFPWCNCNPLRDVHWLQRGRILQWVGYFKVCSTIRLEARILDVGWLEHTYVSACKHDHKEPRITRVTLTLSLCFVSYIAHCKPFHYSPLCMVQCACGVAQHAS